MHKKFNFYLFYLLKHKNPYLLRFVRFKYYLERNVSFRSDHVACAKFMASLV